MAKQTALNAQLDSYYNTLDEFAQQYATHEGAVSVAFQTLLADTARRHHWTLIPQLTAEGIRPDGTLKDPMGLVRGHWEAKDTADNLDVEIGKKIKKGYPLGNIIFEDTRAAVLIQNKVEVMRIDLRDREQLARLLQAFFDYVEPQIASFEKAVDEFKERVPDIAKHLKEKIVEAHATNKKFKDAFESFLEICRTALNPSINQDAVDDMLVQHLLTERLIREIFDNPEFTRRNVIAAEIEKVIAALTSKSFDRNVFLKSLDRFYVAIENAARTITEWSDKQHFLNTVYERFFQGYSVKLADTMGIVYTPQPIVDFMCASVVEVLEKEFGKTLGDKDVNILDPCTGTGNFIVNLIRRIPKKDLKRVYTEQLFANEIMLMPYYIAALNIEHAYFEQTGEYESFEGLCFVDTLGLAESEQSQLSFMTEANTARVESQKNAPINVIIGNPPYNFGQLNENDNNKNRKYSVIDQRVRDTYSKDSRATLKNSLFDPFVKFFRWATDRLGKNDGVVCLVTNNAFVENMSFDGLRMHLLEDFDLVYHLDCRGNVRQNPTLSGTAYNVFGIQVGVGITIAVRKRGLKSKALRFQQLPLDIHREDKLRRLATLGTIRSVDWKSIVPDSRNAWIVPDNAYEFATFNSMGGKEGKATAGDASEVVFQTYCGGIKTNRDDVVYDFDLRQLSDRTRRFIDDYSYEVYRYTKESAKHNVDVDEFVSYEKIKWDGTLKAHLTRHLEIQHDTGKTRSALYRPFVRKYLYFEPKVINRVYLFDRFSPNPRSEESNRVIIASDVAYRANQFSVLVSNKIVDLHVLASSDSHQCFPFYTYDKDGSNRRENITDWALEAFRSHYGSRPSMDDGEGALIRPSGTFSRGEKGGDSEAAGPDPHLSPRERSDAQRPGEGSARHGSRPSMDVGEGALIRPSGTFSRGEKEGDSEAAGPDPHLSPRERSDAQRPGEGLVRHAALDPDLLAFARKLRQDQTEPEQYLWAILRNRRLAGAKFRRQHGLAPYVLDFYCHEAKLAVELDGGQHNSEEGRAKDERRSRFLDERGIRVLRFWNYQVFEDTEVVLDAIVRALEEAQEALTRPLRGRPLPGGEVETEEAQEALTRPLRGRPLPGGEVEMTDRLISKWDIFHYVYGVLHHPGYREKFADNLKRELPRIPFAPDFWAFAGAGEALSKLHLDYETLEPWPLDWIETPGEPLSYRVEKMKLSKDKATLTVNKSLTLGGIPPETGEYRLGNRSALEWVIDQYQVSVDKRSGIKSDPNREDDEEYIVRLVGQVVRVSVETVKIVRALPEAFA